MKYLLKLTLVALFYASSGLNAQPTDNPAASQYGDGYPLWTDSISWDNVYDATSYGAVAGGDAATNGEANFNAFESARDAAAAAGGGVIYFPAGTYFFRLPDPDGVGYGRGPNSRGLMLKDGVVIRGADIPVEQRSAVIRVSEDPQTAEFLDVTHNLQPLTKFVFEFQARGTDPVTLAPDSAGEVPMDWNFIGAVAPSGDLTTVDVVNPNNLGVVNVELEGATVFFNYHTPRAATLATGKWLSQFKVDFPKVGADWASRVPDGTHIMESISGSAGWHTEVSAGHGRLVMNVKISDGTPLNDALYIGRNTSNPVEGFAEYRFTGRIVAHGSDIFIANNVIDKPTRNFGHKQKTSAGDKTVLFDYANTIGIDVNKSNLGGNQDALTVSKTLGSGYFWENVVIRDNWVFSRGNKGYETSGYHMQLLNNHNERYYNRLTIPDVSYVANAESAYGVTSGSISLPGVIFDGYTWQTSESASDFMSRGYDLGGYSTYIAGNSVINTGSIGNDGEGILGQRHNNIEIFGWAIVGNQNGNRNRGPGTMGEPGYIGPYDMHSMGLLLMNNRSTGNVGILKEAGNYQVDVSNFDNMASGLPGGVNGTGPIDMYKEGSGGGATDPVKEIHTDAVTPPSSVTATAVDDVAIDVAWTDAADNELGFRVERSANDGPWETIVYRPMNGATLDAVDPSTTAQAWVFTPLNELNPQLWRDFLIVPGVSYQYRVVAFNANDDDSTGVSEPTTAVTVGEAPLPFPGLAIPFDDYSGGLLSGQDGWTINAVDIGKAIVANGGLSYGAADGGVVDGGSKQLVLSGSSGSKMNNYATRALDPAPTGSTYFRVLMNSSDKGTDTDPGEFFVRLAGWDLYVAAKYYAGIIELPGSNSLEVDTVNGLPLDQTHMLVLKMNAEAGVVTSLDLWLNPEFADVAAPDYSLSGLSVDIANVTSLELRSQNTQISVDEIALAESWAEVVPENATPFDSLAASYDDLSTGQISGQGDWTIAAEDIDKADVADGSLTYISPDGAELPGGSKHLVLSGSPDPKMNNWLTLPIDPLLDDTTYFRALVRTSDSGTIGATSELFIRLAEWSLYVGAKFTDGVIELPGPTILEVDTANGLPVDLTHMILLRMNASAGSVTSLDLWLNPVFADEANPDLTINPFDLDLSSITQIELRSQNSVTQVDEILFAETWAEVVPEAVSEMAPTVLANPSSVSLEVGQSLQLGVAAAGTPTLTYQWRKDETPIDGAVGTTYTIDPVQLTDAGSYDVVVTNAQGSATSLPAVVEVNEPVIIKVVSLFEETFDSGTSSETAAPVALASLGWNVHHSYAGVSLDGLLVDPENADETKHNLLFETSTDIGDFNIGEAYGHQGFFINNYPLYGEGEEGARPALPGPHPVTGNYYSNRTLATFLWKEATIAGGDRSIITDFNFVQGNRDASQHTFFPAVRIGGQWYVYVVDQATLGTDVRILGRPGQNDSNGAETVFSGSQFSEGGAYANYYNAQPYNFKWSETGWTELVFDGGNGTNSTVGMTLGDPLDGALPMSDITAVGVYSPETIDPAYKFNGLRIDSIQVLGLAREEDFFTFTFNNEGTVNGSDRPIQAADWDGLYSSTAQPLLTNDATLADLSEGVSSDETPGSYKAGFLFVSGKNGEPAPEGFLIWSSNTNVVDQPQLPQGDPIVNPQTDWYSDPENSVTNLNQLLAKDLGELQMRIKPRNAAIRYHFALKISGDWYVSEQSLQHSGIDPNAWESVSLNAGSVDWLSGVVGAGSINFDFGTAAPTVVTLADLPADAKLETIGIYIDTDSGVGENDTWARVDSITLSSIVPELQGPAITEQPSSLAVTEGGTAEFMVGVEVSDGVTYQWRKDQVNLEGETGATLTLTGVVEADEGDYDVVVTNAGGSVPSQAASLVVYAMPELDQVLFSVDSGSQALQIILTAEANEVTWTSAESQDDWIAITYAGGGSGSDLILFSVTENTGYTERSGSLTVAGQTVTVNQEAKPLPASFAEAVGAIDNEDGTFTSPWFGTYTAPVADWLIHDEVGILNIGAVVIPEDMIIYSVGLQGWAWTSVSAFPILYEFSTGEWVYCVVEDNVAYVYSYSSGTWSF